MVQPLVIGGDPFQHHDADRFIDQGPSARFLAGVRADPAAHRRDRHVAADGVEGLAVAVVLDLLDVGRNVDVRRAAVGAGGGQLVVVALGRPGLPFAAQERQIVIAEVLDAVEYRPGGGHAQGALAILEQIGQAGQGIEIALRPLAVHDARQGIHHDPRAALAGGALGAAVLFLHALHVLGGHGDHVDLAVVEDDPVPAHEGADAPLIQIVLGQFEYGSLRLAALAVVDHLAAPTGKDHVSQNVPPASGCATHDTAAESAFALIPLRFPPASGFR